MLQRHDAAVSVSKESDAAAAAASVSKESDDAGELPAPTGSTTTTIAALDYVRERERLELEALYPSVVHDPWKPYSVHAPECVNGDPSFFLLVGNDQVEAKLKKTSDAIDFGYPGLRVTPFEFVGLRYVPQRMYNFSSTPYFSDSHYSSRNSIRKVLMSILDFYRKTVLSTSPVSSKPSNPSANASTQNPSPHNVQKNENGPSYTMHVIHHIEKHVEEENGTSPRRMTWGGGDLLSKKDPGLPTWEIMWKEGGKLGEKSLSPLRRLRFQTDAVGFLHLSSKLDSWSVAAHSDQIMTDAAIAALSISQDNSTEAARSNAQPSDSFYFPHSSSSPSHLFHSSFPTPQSSSNESMSSITKGVQSLRTSFKGTVTAVESLSHNIEVFTNGFFKAKDIYGRKEENSTNSVTSPVFPSLTGNGSEKPEKIGQVEAARAARELVSATPESNISKVLPDNFMSWGSVTVEGKYLPNREGQSLILSDNHFKALATALPVRFRSCNWTLLYSTVRDGISLNTLYRKVNKRGPSILVLRDSRKHVFGCFCSEEWRISNRYYGNGECYIFQVQPELRAFKWTRANNYFMFSQTDFLAMGGGSHYGLLLNSDLLSGYSGECETFANKSLSSTEDFEIAQVEVWGFK